MATQPDPTLVQEMLRYRGIRDNNLREGATAAPFAVAASSQGGAGAAMAMADRFIADRMSPYEIAQAKAALKLRVLQQMQQGQASSMSGISGLLSAGNSQNDLMADILKTIIMASTADAATQERLIANVNTSSATIHAAGLSASARTKGGTGPSGGAVRSFISDLYTDLGTANFTNDTRFIEKIAQELTIQEGIRASAVAAGDQEAAAQAEASAAAAVYAANQALQERNGTTLDEVLTHNFRPETPGLSQVQEAWAKAKNQPPADDGSEASATISAKWSDAIDDLQRTAPAGLLPGLEVAKGYLKFLGIGPVDQQTQMDRAESLIDKANPTGQTIDAGHNSNLLADIDSANPDPSLRQARQALYDSPKFQQWKRQNGFRTDEIAFKELRRTVSLQHFQEQQQDRATARSRAQGGVDANSGPAQGTLAHVRAPSAPMVDRGSAGAPAAAEPEAHSPEVAAAEPRKTVVVADDKGSLWVSDEAGFHEATPEEKADIEAADKEARAAGGTVILPASEFEKIKADAAAPTAPAAPDTTPEQKAGGDRFRAALRENVEGQATDADPTYKPPIPGFNAGARAAVRAVTHPSYTVQRALGPALHSTGEAVRRLLEKRKEKPVPPTDTTGVMKETLPSPVQALSPVEPTTRSPGYEMTSPTGQKLSLTDEGVTALNGQMPAQPAPTPEQIRAAMESDDPNALRRLLGFPVEGDEVAPQ